MTTRVLDVRACSLMNAAALHDHMDSPRGSEIGLHSATEDAHFPSIDAAPGGAGTSTPAPGAVG